MSITSGPTVPDADVVIDGSLSPIVSVAFVRHLIAPSRSSASAIRARLSSRPSSTSTSNIPGEVARPVSAARSGCATWPSLTPAALGNLPHRLLRRLGASIRQAPERAAWTRASRSGASPSSRAAAFSSMSSGTRLEQEGRAFGQFVEILRARLQHRHRLGEQIDVAASRPRPSSPRSAARPGRPAGRRRPRGYNGR